MPCSRISSNVHLADEGKKKNINHPANLLSKFEYFFPLFSASKKRGQKQRERERKIRNKNATRFRLILALLLEAENKPRQRR